MYIETLFNMNLELITMHHLGGEWRIPGKVEDSSCGLLTLPNHSQRKALTPIRTAFLPTLLDNGYKNPGPGEAEMLHKVNVSNLS